VQPSFRSRTRSRTSFGGQGTDFGLIRLQALPPGHVLPHLRSPRSAPCVYAFKEMPAKVFQLVYLMFDLPVQPINLLSGSLDFLNTQRGGWSLYFRLFGGVTGHTNRWMTEEFPHLLLGVLYVNPLASLDRDALLSFQYKAATCEKFMSWFFRQLFNGLPTFSVFIIHRLLFSGLVIHKLIENIFVILSTVVSFDVYGSALRFLTSCLDLYLDLPLNLFLCHNSCYQFLSHQTF